jgi:hypothetical protein
MEAESASEAKAPALLGQKEVEDAGCVTGKPLNKSSQRTLLDEEEEDSVVKQTKKSFLSRLSFGGHRRTNSTEKMMSGIESTTIDDELAQGNVVTPEDAEKNVHDVNASEDAQTQKQPNAEGAAILDVSDADVASGGDALLRSASPSPPSSASSSPKMDASSAAVAAGKLAARQRERASDPKAALGALTTGGHDQGGRGARSWFGGWGSAKPPTRPRTSSNDKYGAFEDDEAGADKVRRSGRVAGKEPEEEAHDTSLAAIETAIERNQAEQQELKDRLHAKQSELSALCAQHAAMLRKAAEKQQANEEEEEATPAGAGEAGAIS